jgi:hypothetical protein
MSPRRLGFFSWCPSRASLASVTLLAVKAVYAPAQCVGNLGDEIGALQHFADSVYRVTFAKKDAGSAPEPSWDKFTNALKDDAAFIKTLADAGAAGQCLLPLREAFRSTAAAALTRAIPKKALAVGDSGTVRSALLSATGTVLATRYSPTDRFSAVFGFGMAVAQGYAPQFKVISRRGIGADTATHLYIVQESNSRAQPIGMTGLAIRFRDRQSSCGSAREPKKACPFWVVDHLWPTSVFGAVQLGGGEGTVSGTTLGAGWQLVADVNVLVGYGITRVAALRRDVRRAFDAEPSGILLMPAGETSESIMGTESQRSFTVTLSIPLALKNLFGGH